MPCDQVRTVTIDFKNANLDVLEAAFKNMGHRVKRTANGLYVENEYGDDVARYDGNSMTIYDDSFTEDELNAEYMKAAVEATAKKFAAWKIVKKNNKLVLRRSY
jgi:hypothetical protein